MERKELEITAQLAQLELSQEETARFERAVEQMLEYFAKMRECEVEGLPPTTQLAADNRTRSDEVQSGVDPEALLANAPEREERFIVVPNVL